MKKQKKQTTIEFPDEFYILGADLSLNRPGYALLYYHDKKLELVRTSSVDNKVNSKKTRGQKLCENLNGLKEITDELLPQFYVREASINNSSFGKRSGTAARTGISEMVGVTDLWLWISHESEWDEIYPISIKKCVTGNSKATKEEVAECLSKYIGEHEYKNDDESDAAAVAIAWLIKNNLINTIEDTNEK